MERSRKKTSFGRIFGERLEQIFCHDSALAIEITVEVRFDIEIYFFRIVYICKCFSAFRDGICDFRRPPGFSRPADAAKRNGRSGSIIKEFGKGVDGFRKRKCCKIRGRRKVGINISKVIVPASFIVIK